MASTPAPPQALAPELPQRIASAASTKPPAAASVASAPIAKAVKPFDTSKFQRDVQEAISSDKPGLAGPAARHIAACVGLERMREDMQAVLEERQRARANPQYRETVAGMDQFFAGCQALDAAARAQLLPLLRRSLQEGDRGTGAELARQLGSDFDPTRETEVVASLRRDAWACDRSSISVLVLLLRRHPQLLTANEQGALRQMQRSSPMARALADGHPAYREQMERRFKLPAEVDPAEVARLSATIQAQCRDDD